MYTGANIHVTPGVFLFLLFSVMFVGLSVVTTTHNGIGQHAGNFLS